MLVRIQRGQERENYGVTYREAQEAIEAEISRTFDARARAYLLLKQHGQTLCKRSNPKCDGCPVSSSCAYFAGKRRGGPLPPDGVQACPITTVWGLIGIGRPVMPWKPAC